MAQALAPGPDAQSSQIGEQPLEVEGRQRGLCLLRGLLQAGRDRESVGQPDVGTEGTWGPQEPPSVPRPQRPPCLPTPLPPSLRTRRPLTGTGAEPVLAAWCPEDWVDWRASEPEPILPPPVSGAQQVGSARVVLGGSG